MTSTLPSTREAARGATIAAVSVTAPTGDPGPAQGAGASRAGRRWMLALRLLLAALCLFAAAAWVFGEPPVSQGDILLTVSEGHGVDERDLAALPAVVAAVVLVWPRRRRRRDTSPGGGEAAA